MRTLLVPLLIALALAGCAENPEPPTAQAPALHDEPAATGSTSMPSADHAQAMTGRPAAVGDWINGSHLRARLVAAEARPSEGTAHERVILRFEFVFLASENMTVDLMPNSGQVYRMNDRSPGWEIEVPTDGDIQLRARIVQDDDTGREVDQGLFRWRLS